MPKPVTKPIPRKWLTLRTISEQEVPICEFKDKEKTFTVMSYNQLSASGIKREKYDYAGKKTLKWKYRRQNLLDEVLNCDPSIICFQEHCYYSWWQEKLDSYDSIFCLTREGSHGSSIFFKKELFEIVDQKMIRFECMKDEVKNAGYEFSLHNVAEVAVLRVKGSEKTGLIVSNGHLYWNWKLHYVRVRQILKLMEICLDFKKKYPTYSIINCGDFNCTPDSLEYKLFHDGSQSWNEEDWQALKDPNDSDETKYDTRIQEAKSIIKEYEHVRMRSVYDSYEELHFIKHSNNQDWSGSPPYSSFEGKWQGWLDYICCMVPDWRLVETKGGWRKSTGLVPLKVLEIPEPEILSVETALPNTVFSSDHLSIMCEFALIDQDRFEKE